MKKIIILIAVCCFTFPSFAQIDQKALAKWRTEFEKVYKDLDTKIQQLEKLLQQASAPTPMPTQVSSTENYDKRLADLSNQLNAIIQDIQIEHKKYEKSENFTSLYKDKKGTQAFNALRNRRERLEGRKQSIQDSIDLLDKEYERVQELRNYYTQNDLDFLFAHSDSISLQIHKQLIGQNNCPPVMKDLEIMLKCADLLKRPYDATQVQNARQKLKQQVQSSCKSKSHLDRMLAIYERVSKDVENRWLNKEEHGLYELSMLNSYLSGEYEIDLNKDFPYLAQRVNESIKFQAKQK